MKLNSANRVDTNLYELSVDVEGNVLDTAINAVYRRQAKKFNVPGFRKGKATRGMIERLYGAEIFYEDALNDILPGVIDEAIREADLDVVGFSYDDLDMGEIGKDGFSFTTKVTVKPEVEIGAYKGLTVEKPAVTVSDDDVDGELKTIQERNARLVTVEDRAAQEGDIAVIDFTGFVDGEEFGGGNGQDYTLKLGAGQFIPGFEEQVVSRTVGEEFDVNVTFPEDYHAENLTGKAARFHVTLKELKFRELPVLDDEFAKDVSEFDTLDEYKADTARKIRREREKDADQAAEDGLTDQLVEGVQGEIPDIMYVKKIDDDAREMAARLQSQGLSLDTYLQYTGMSRDNFHESLRPQAERQVKLRLALEKIVALEEIPATDEELEEEYNTIASAYKMEVAQIKKMIPDEDLRMDIKVRKAMDLVKESAVVTEVPAMAEAAEEDINTPQ